MRLIALSLACLLVVACALPAKAAAFPEFSGCWLEYGERETPDGPREIVTRMINDFDTLQSVHVSMEKGSPTAIMGRSYYDEARLDESQKALLLLRRGKTIQTLRLDEQNNLLVEFSAAEASAPKTFARCTPEAESGFEPFALSENEFSGIWTMDGEGAPLLRMDTKSHRILPLGRRVADFLGKSPVPVDMYMEIQENGQRRVGMFLFTGPKGEQCQAVLNTVLGPGEPPALIFTIDKAPIINSLVKIIKN